MIKVITDAREEGLSDGKIAISYGVTRNTIIGFRHRWMPAAIGPSAKKDRKPHRGQPRTYAPRNLSAPKPVTKSVAVIRRDGKAATPLPPAPPLPNAAPMGRVSLTKPMPFVNYLRGVHCCWIIGDGTATAMCCGDAADPKPRSQSRDGYCVTHGKVAVGEITRNEYFDLCARVYAELVRLGWKDGDDSDVEEEGAA